MFLESEGWSYSSLPVSDGATIAQVRTVPVIRPPGFSRSREAGFWIKLIGWDNALCDQWRGESF